MSNTIKLNHCPKCGAPIPPEAPQGLCPKCVLGGAAIATEAGVPATATSEIPSLERLAAAFPQLEILELIGRGGMGFVFKARQPHLDRFVALKLLPDKLARDPRFAERFNREGRVLARLNHPNIVSVYDFGMTEHFYFLVMEFVDGVNLRQAMQAGRFSPGEALSIVPRICEALQYAHEQGILHRDIKPENILLDARGHVKIADFGIAKLVGDDKPDVSLTATGAALGTPHYMAPEQLEKPAEVDHRADIYSLGVVFYEMLTGELPIGRFAAPSSKTPVGPAVDEVVFRTLEKDRERRFQSAGEMKEEVEHITETGEDSAARATRTGEHSDWANRVTASAPKWLVPAAIGFLALGASAVPSTLRGWALSPFAFDPLLFIALTGVALLTRSTAWRRVALVGSGLGLLLPWLSPANVLDAFHHWTLPVGWFPSVPRLPRHATLALLLALLRYAAWGASLRLLLRSDIKALFLERPRTQSRYSRRSLYGAVLVGLSLPFPLLMIAFLLLGRGGIGPVELGLALGSVALPGLGGTLLGWLGLNEIRDGGGRVRGLPLALFATLTWPLALLSAIIIGFPMFFTVMEGELTAASTLGHILVLLLPAGVITFGVWAIYATARWASRQPVGQRRGVLKWVFIVLLLAGIGVMLASRTGSRQTLRPAPAETSMPVATSVPVERAVEAEAGPHPIQIHFRLAKGQVAVFEVLRRDDDRVIPTSLVGYAVAPDDERARFSLVLTPTEPFPTQTNRPAWRFSLTTEDGASAFGTIEDFGEIISNIPTNYIHAIEPDSSGELMLTRPYPSADTNGFVPRPILGLSIVSQARGTLGGPQVATTVSAGSTNWAGSLRQHSAASSGPRPRPGEVLAYQWLKSPVGTNTTNTIRFTFTNVELRNENDKQWMAMDYATDVRGDCEEVFRVDGPNIVTRKTGLLVPLPDAAPVRRQRWEWQIPAQVDPATIQELTAEFAKSLVGKSFLIPEGEQRPLLHLPVGTVSDISVGIGARRRAPPE